MQLTNKVALVTGAGSGIAKAATKLFAKEGAKVAALGRTKEELEETVAEIQSNNGEAIPLIADISQPEEMQQAIEQIADKSNLKTGFQHVIQCYKKVMFLFLKFERRYFQNA